MAAPITSDVLFNEAVAGLFRSWTALQLAVSHGFGGVFSEEKSVWLVYATETWFQENSNIDPYECEEFLEDILNQEFDLIVDDGSTKQISKKICAFYKLCKDKKYDEIREEIKKLPAAQVKNSQKVDSDDEVEVEDADMESNNCASQPQASSSQPQASSSQPQASSSQPSTSQISSSQRHNASSGRNTETEMETEDDGWSTVVRKSKHK